MNLDSLSFALSEISYSVANLAKKNSKSSIAEISHLVSLHGSEADRHLFRCLFSHVDFSSDGKNCGKDFHQTQYLIQECATLLTKPNFVSLLCYSIDNPLHHQKTLKPSAHLFPQLSKVLKLNRVQEVAFGLGLLHSSNPETQTYATQYTKQKLPHLINSYIDTAEIGTGESKLKDIAIEVLHLILSSLAQVQGSEHLGISSEQKQAFLTSLKKEFPESRAPVVLAPLLYPSCPDPTPEQLQPDSINMPKTMVSKSLGKALPMHEQLQPDSIIMPKTMVSKRSGKELPTPEQLQPDSINMPKTMMEGSLADMILEVGYGCTATLEECRNTLVQFGIKEVTAASVARVLGMMARTPSGLTDQISVQSMNTPGGGSMWSEGKDKPESGGPTTWNVDIFVQVVKDLAPHMNWREVVEQLDHPGFIVLGKPGLRILMQGLFRGLQDVFPIELVYVYWKNTEGQLSWITQALKNPDVFCLEDYIIHSVVIDILKTPPDEDNRDIATWKSLELVEILLRLSEAGHYQAVSDLFKFPVTHCPDMLVLALLQIPTWNTMKHELLSGLMPTFLGNHPNSGIVLHYAWHCQGQSTTIRTLVMHAMAEWYMRGEHHDQSRLSRILDVAQDLKALSMLLNATPFAFVIDLACLASRREYLKLDKWLSDKIREHGEPFVQACVNFLKRRCPQLMGSAVKDEPQARSQQLPADTLGTMLTCLQACAVGVAQELSEAILTMVANASMIMNKARQAPPGAVGAKHPPGSQVPMGHQALSRLSNPGIANQTSNPMDSLGPIAGMGPIGMPPSQSAASTSSISTSFPAISANTAFPPSSGNPGFPAGLTSLMSTPGSPAKSFGSMPQVSESQVFNPMNTLTSQLQGVNLGLNMQTTMSTGLNIPTTMSTGRASTLAGLSAAAIKPTGEERIRPGFPAMPAGMKRPSSPGLAANLGVGVSATSGQTSDASSIFNSVSQQFSKDIEDEANSYFQRIYNHPPHPTISIDEVLDMLKKFKDSPVKKEREVFACMLRNLFEEYRFFPQYPDKELHITAVLFGGIIEQGLVTYMDLGIALRYVLEALKKPHASKMYFFGVAALDRFKTRLKDYPQYCQHLASIPHFSQFPQHLIEYVECGARSAEPPNRPQGPVTTRSLTPVSMPGGNMPGTVAATPSTSTTTTTTAAATPPTPIARPNTSSVGTPSKEARPNPNTQPSIANATNIDTLLAGTDSKEEIDVPPESLQDKVFFIFNNLSLANMEQKAAELLENVGDEYMMWVAQYLVMKRASIEPNFHTLYAQFLDQLKKPAVTEMVISETYRNIIVLLRSDKGVANFSDRSLLKNLGHWLGLLTLAKNKPVLHIDIDVKSLLYEAYYNGAQELLYVVPFVAKVIESCAKSKVFKPPNPWTMGIMNALAELHTEPDLKLNLKFEIEVLCKALNLDINNDLKVVTYLRDPERLQHLKHQLSAPKAKDQQPPALPPPPVAMPPATQPATPQPEESILPPPPTTAMTPMVMHTNIQSSTPTTQASTSASTPPQPQFSYHDINIISLQGLAQHISINEQLSLFQAHPQLKQFVRPAIERSVQELLPPVVERSIKIALTTCEQIVKKDFALDPEEARMRAAAHHMVRNMTAGMALITCREPLLISINTNLKTAFLAAVRTASQSQKELIEQAAQMVSQDNTELACAFIQKTAVEKAIPEIDKRLATEFEFRKHARTEGRRYCDPVVLTYQAERMPEQIRLKVGGVTQQQIAVYEEFARNIPGFLPTSHDGTQNTPFLAKPAPPALHADIQNIIKQPPGDMNMQSYVTDEITQIYDKIAREIEQHLHAVMTPHNNPQVALLHSLLEAVLLARNSREIVTALALLQKAVEGLLDGFTNLPSDPELMLRFRDCHLLVLKGLQDHRAYGPQWTNKHVTRCLMECREDFRYNLEAVEVLIRSQLVNMQQYDMHLATSMENGLNYMAVAFTMQLVQRFCMDDKHGTHEAEFFNTIETLARIAAHSRQAPDGLTTLIDSIRQRTDGGLLDRAPGGPTSMMHSGISQAREFDDPPGLHEKTEYLLREWVTMYHSPAAGRDSTKAFSAFVQQMHSQGILKTDDLITRFFRLCTEMCVDLCYRALAEQTHGVIVIRAKCFHTLDAFVRLIALLVKHSGDTSNTVTKINLLNKVLGIVAGVLLQDHEVRHTEFQQLPYHRIFIMLFIDLNAPEHVLESINFQVLTAFCNTYHILRPAKAPGFAYAWLELVSHRVFIGRMLAISPQQRGWNMYAQLLIDLFKFLAPFLRNAELAKPTQLLYKGTLRVLLVLLHDFPEFLCDYHYAFCDVVPPNCIQMRNLILSAFPRNMRLPDPFTPNLKVDMLAEINHPPRIMTNFANMIQPVNFKKDLDSYLKTRSPVTFLSELRSNLQVSSEPGMRYNISLINALVLYVGTQAIAHIHSKGLSPGMSTIAHSSHMDIFQNLAVDLDTEGRYLFLNAIANQLRYPNSHTHYFSCTLLYLFAEANTEAIQEQITRVLLERLIVNRPHPWGLLITFIELIKNPQFKFWNHEFVHCAPEIEKLFDSVARSCMQPRQSQQTLRESEVQEVH